MEVAGISPLVDSCTRLVHKKALRTFRRISPENKRWIDIEDVIQDGVIEAWQASQRYEAMWGENPTVKPAAFKSRFSSYLWTGLDQRFSAAYAIPLRQRKRVAALTELDAPIPGEDTFRDLPAKAPSQEILFQAASGLVKVCYVIPPAAADFLIAVIGCETAKIRRRTADDIACIPVACRQFGVERQDLDMVLASPWARGVVLEGVLRSTASIGYEDAKVLECVTCSGMFSLKDAREGKYSATSLTCTPCLKKLSSPGSESTCFGRRKEVQNNKTVTEGFSIADTECRLHCRDRKACRQLIQERKHIMAKVDNIDVDVDDVDFSDVEAADTSAATTEAAPAKSKTSKTKSKKAPAKETKPVKADKKPAKPAKPAKAAAKKEPKKAAKKAEKSKGTRTAKSSEKMDPKQALKDGLIKLDEKGRDLPFKEGSTMRYVLTQALEHGGAVEKELEKEIIKLGYDWKFQRTVIMSGQSGESSLRPYPSTHTWTAEAKNGRIYVSNVKRIAFYKRMARIDGRK